MSYGILKIYSFTKRNNRHEQAKKNMVFSNAFI